ncbi:hypothetical protein EVAR_69499_1 [Eumeta japonica]|uniref:Uncharacterized protein n=1 Tax=Eumeta variegata TaxID=151549 RepID=A0A4C2AHE0_EUMVA|nr:hypothetical protein EVAR_69499_1 [Eumeta japonica]
MNQSSSRSDKACKQPRKTEDLSSVRIECDRFLKIGPQVSRSILGQESIRRCRVRRDLCAPPPTGRWRAAGRGQGLDCFSDVSAKTEAELIDFMATIAPLQRDIRELR